MPDHSTPYSYPDLAKSTISQIAALAGSGGFIFRGENQYREEPAKSSLYREYENTPILAEIGINSIQEAELSIARLHVRQAISEEHLLHQLQHHRGKTNLIDFSENYLIALFFACDGNPDQDGRLIFLERSRHAHLITKPTEPAKRVKAQKSVFISPENGYIPLSCFTQMPIPKEIKRPILDILGDQHDITGSRIYNDLHGYVTRRELTHQTLDDVARGISFYNQGHYLQAVTAYQSAMRLQPENTIALLYSAMAHHHSGEHKQAISLTSSAIQLNPNLKEAYNLRGRAQASNGNHQQALHDYSKAIAIDPQYEHPYNSRGLTYYALNNLPAAIKDFTTAIRLAPQRAIPYANRAAAHYLAGYREFALADLDKAIERDCMMAAYYHARAQIRTEMGIAGADDDLRKAASLEHDPANDHQTI